MSLRLRLTFKLGAAFVLIWALAAAWMLNDLRNQMMFSLDQRLVASARMVAGLMEQMPGLASSAEGKHFSAEQLNVPGGMACQVSSLRGEVLARSHTTPDQGLESHRSVFATRSSMARRGAASPWPVAICSLPPPTARWSARR